MSDPYEEEEKAQAKAIALWCEGRFGDLLREGLIAGGTPKLTLRGEQAYRDLLATGYTPNPKRVRDYLKYAGSVDDNSLDGICKLMLRFDEHSKEHTNDTRTMVGKMDVFSWPQQRD